MTNAADALAVPCRVHVAWSRREPMAGIEIACNYLVQHRRDMLSACWRKLLILVASPAGFEPATCGLEIGTRTLIFQEKYGLCCVVAACRRSHSVALVRTLWREPMSVRKRTWVN